MPNFDGNGDHDYDDDDDNDEDVECGGHETLDMDWLWKYPLHLLLWMYVGYQVGKSFWESETFPKSFLYFISILSS